MKQLYSRFLRGGRVSLVVFALIAFSLQPARAQFASTALAVGSIYGLVGLGSVVLAGVITVPTAGRAGWYLHPGQLIQTRHAVDRDLLRYRVDTLLSKYGYHWAASLRRSVHEELFVNGKGDVVQIKYKRGNKYRIRAIMSVPDRAQAITYARDGSRYSPEWLAKIASGIDKDIQTSKKYKKIARKLEKDPNNKRLVFQLDNLRFRYIRKKASRFTYQQRATLNITEIALIIKDMDDKTSVQ